MAEGAGALVVCGTPIGNLADASPRLAQALAAADVVACEDTRHSRKLLDHLGVRAHTVAYHDFNERQQASVLADRVAAGERVALVTDAGMPTVSDPGYLVVKECLDRGLTVEVVPGPSAVLGALVVSGLPTDRFCFEGFLSKRQGQRTRRLAELAAEPRTLVFFESPQRIGATLAELAQAFGSDRPAALTRELTKLHEEVVRGTLGSLAERYGAEAVRGEVTLVVGGAPAPEPDATGLAEKVADHIAGGSDRRTAMAEVARQAGVSRRMVYQALLEERTGKPPDDSR